MIKYYDDCKTKPLNDAPKSEHLLKSYDGETKWMNFLIKNDDLLKKYNDIWNKVSNSIKKEVDCEPIYNKMFLETKIKSYGNEDTDFNSTKKVLIDN